MRISPQTMTQSTMSRDSIQRKDQGYIPMNIQMIKALMEKGKPYVIGNIGVDNITLVAKVKSLSSNIYRYCKTQNSPENVPDKGGSIDMILEDETGTINGIIFKRTGAESVKPILGYEPKLNSYAFLIGSLMNFNGNDIIVVARMQNVNEYSFVLMHRVQIFWAFLVRNGIMHANINEKPSSDFADRLNQADTDDYAQLNKDQRTIMEYIKNKELGTGVHKDEIFKACRLSSDMTRKALDQLVEYGFLYTNAECDVFYLT